MYIVLLYSLLRKTTFRCEIQGDYIKEYDYSKIYFLAKLPVAYALLSK